MSTYYLSFVPPGRHASRLRQGGLTVSFSLFVRSRLTWLDSSIFTFGCASFNGLVIIERFDVGQDS